MRILGRLIFSREIEEELDAVRERLEESDDRLDEAKRLTREATRRLEILEARVRIHRETVA